MAQERPAPACPELGILAAYVDGSIDMATRVSVNSHLAGCERCYELVAELAREHEQRARRWTVGRREGLAVAASLLILASGVLTVRALNPAWWEQLWNGAANPRLATLVGAIGERRITEGRLSGGFAFGPVMEPKRSAPSAGDNLSLIAAAGEIQKRAEVDPTPENLHAWGVALLALGRYDGSVDTLEDAVLQRPEVARYRNDLGVARLARATALDRPDDLPKALEDVERALERDAALREAWFNKALLLERLRLQSQAIAAWERYLQLDPDSAWSTEAREHLKQLRSQPQQGRWVDLERELRAGNVSEQLLMGAARDFPEDLRELLIRDWLPAWATAVISGSATDEVRAMHRLEQAARALQREYPDGYLPGVIAMLPHAGPTRPELARGIRALAEGAGAIAENRYKDARVALDSASAALGRAGSPLAAWATLQLAHAVFIDKEWALVAELLRRAAADGERLASPSLAMRAAWFDGMLAFTTGDWHRAVDRYRAALQHGERTRDPQLASRVHVNASILYSFLGDRRLTWLHRLAATSLVPPHRPYQVHAYLITGAGTASLESLPLAALQFQHEVVANALAHLPAGPQVEAFMARARLRTRLQQYGEAEEDLKHAATKLDEVKDTGMHLRLRATWLVAAADVQLDTKPDHSAAHAAEAVAILDGEPMRSAELRLLESRALERIGKLQQARSSAREGIADFEYALNTIDPADATGLSALEPVWGLYAHAARLYLPPAAKDFDDAFDLLERSRARTLLERRRIQPLTLPVVRSRLQKDQALLLLQQFPEELVTWLIRRGDVEVRRTPCRESDVSAHVARHRRSIAAGERRDAASAALFDCVIGPWWTDLHGTSTLAIVPDAVWQRVAWPALWERTSGRELITEVDSVVASSASVAVAAGSTGTATASGVLVVSSTSGDDEHAPLPGAREEARAIARLHQDVRVIEGVSATPETFKAEAVTARVIHVASHAVDTPAYPLLSHLVLAGAEPSLFARDIARLDLSHTKVVVLAACATAGRRSIRGEGSVGVAWSFLTAGAPRVIATLDEVDDQASSRLFVEIHRELARGASPVEAVGRVQRAMAARAESPRVWAGVTVIGAL